MDKTLNHTCFLNEEIACRPALHDENGAVAELICQAGGGLYEFLLDDLIPFMSARDIVAWGVEIKSSPFSYENCCVAAAATSNRIVGVANVFPAKLVNRDAYSFLGSDRLDLIRPMLELQDWESMLLNAIAVADGYRGRGVGRQLMNWAESYTLRSGLKRLSLHVWADNTEAIRLYRSLGFLERGIAKIASHPRLPHRGGSILMRKILA
jgi:ribosomal protein S18 acetylase RimI-like enzyme